MDDKIIIQELIKEGLLEKEKGMKILQESYFSRRPAEDFIYEQRIVDEEKLAALKSRLLNIPYKKIIPNEISDNVLKLIPEETVRNYKVIPISYSEGILVVGMINPDDFKAQDALKFIAKQLKVNLGVYLVTHSVWEAILRRYSPYRSLIDEAVKSLTSRPGATFGGGQIIHLEEKLSGSEEAPIIKIVSATLKEAVWVKASDIHIEPLRNRSRIRFRIDGELQEVASIPTELHAPIVSRIKILSNLKIDESRIPQDGRFRTTLFGKDIDYRVATFPTPVGEKAVIRVLDPTVGIKGLEELGLTGNNLNIIKEGIKKPYGMILLTGPTGSGKTTTLYAIMQILNKEDVNIVSLEDPVEYFIDGLNQSQVKPEIGYDFASGLRQILRQDPDIIMVGEIRDKETAGLTVHAALTGHIVLSTLHTNNSIGVIPRLIDLGIQPFLLPASLNIMAAQRLVSRLCQNCRKPYEAVGEIRELIKKELAGVDLSPELKQEKSLKLFKSEGCELCKGKGVVGRIALFEAFIMTPELEQIIISGPSENLLNEEARRQKMITMRQDGIIKALQGLVSIEEVLRETTMRI